MSTRSRIGLDIGNGVADTIYCHHDGYPQYMGKMLLEHYTSRDKIEVLIRLGDLSTLREYIVPIPTMTHTFDKPQRNVCIAYGRDRGEKNVHSRPEEESDLWSDSWEEFNYLFKDGVWLYRDAHDCGNHEWKILTEEDCVD